MNRAHLAHIRALDGLRGVAVLAVVLFHANHLTGGYLGVDLFFVLSGFLITSLLLEEHRSTGRIALGRFWARRARRLLPALVVVLSGAALYALTVAAPSQITTLRGDAFATLGYVANWRAIFSGRDYWALFLSPSALEHTWSLAIEEQFYLAWPLVILGVATLRRTALAHVVLVMSLVGAAGSYLALQVVFRPSDTARAYYGTDTRAASILLGAALAAWFASHPDPFGPGVRRGIAVAGAVGAVVLAVAWSRLAGDDPFLYRVGFLISAVLSAAIIATVVQLPSHFLTRGLEWRPLVLLGLVSYGVYLWHWPVDIVITAERMGVTGWPLIAMQSAITLALAVLSYRFVELPIRRGWGARQTWQFIVPALALGLIGLILVGTARAESATGLNARAAASPYTAASLGLQRLALDLQVDPAAPRVLLGGDSIAFSLAEGANRPGHDALGVANVAVVGCGIGSGDPIGPKYSAPAGLCGQWPRTWRRAVRVFHPAAIVLLDGAWDIWPREVGNRKLAMYSTGLERDFRGALSLGRSIAAATGVPLVLLTVPCLRPTPAEMARIGPGLDEPRRVGWINRIYRSFAAQYSDVALIELGRRVCERPWDQLDGVHFSNDGARAAWDWLTPRIQAIIAEHPRA